MYYVYALIDLRTKLPFYVGKGKKENIRHLDHFKESVDHNSNRHKIFKMNHLRSLGLDIPVEILNDNIEDEDNAYDIESSYIRKYGRENIDPGGILVNILLDSRKPPSAKGKKQSATHKAKRAASRKKTVAERGLPPQSLLQRNLASERMKGEKNHFYGKSHSIEFSRAQSEMMQGNQFNAKDYEFISPSGEKFQVSGFAKFCRENNLSIATMEKGMYKNKWPITGKCVGWKVKQQDKNNEY